MNVVRLGTHQLAYEVAGSGRPLLFIAGSGATMATTPRSFVAPFARGRALISSDLRGFGTSTLPDGAATTADYADDVAAVVGAARLGPVDVVGFSFGGLVAQHLAARHPSLVRALVLVATASGGRGGSLHPLPELDGLAPAARARRHLAIADTRFDGGADARWSAQLRFLTPPAAPSARHVAAVAIQRRARALHDAWGQLAGIAAPTLVCAGRFDGVSSPARAEALAAAIPGAELVWLDAGHLVWFASGAHAAVLQFLDRPAVDAAQPVVRRGRRDARTGFAAPSSAMPRPASS